LTQDVLGKRKIFTKDKKRPRPGTREESSGSSGKKVHIESAPEPTKRFGEKEVDSNESGGASKMGESGKRVVGEWPCRIANQRNGSRHGHITEFYWRLIRCCVGCRSSGGGGEW